MRALLVSARVAGCDATTEGNGPETPRMVAILPVKGVCDDGGRKGPL